METKNQESKFFSVEIGIETRRGNFIKHHSFVCKTQLDTMDVHEYYRKKYHGFAVNVESINEVVALDEKAEIKKPELNSDKIISFIGKMSFGKFTKSTREQLITLDDLRIQYNSLQDDVEYAVKNEIMKRNTLIESVVLHNGIPKRFSNRNLRLDYTANVNGSFTEYTDREIQEED